MSQFFLCHNPLAPPLPPNKTGYIYHYTKPRFFAHIFRIDDTAAAFKHMDYAGANKIFLYKTADEKQHIFSLIIDQKIDRASAKIYQALEGAAKWYGNVLNIEDAKTCGGNSELTLLHDFNLLTAELQVLHLKKADKYMLSYPHGLKTFDDADALDAFVLDKLRYDPLQFEKGRFNTS